MAKKPGRVGIDKSPRDVRDELVRTLRLDLVGPGADDELAEEQLPGRYRPANWYLTGFLIPSNSPQEQRADPEADDELDETPAFFGLPEESLEERKAAKKEYFPSSFGLSFLVDPETRTLAVEVRWGDYHSLTPETPEGKAQTVWQRQPQRKTVEWSLNGIDGPHRSQPLSDSGGLELHLVERAITAAELEEHLPRGTRSISVFLVNNRPANPVNPDEAFVFQPELIVAADRPFIARPDLRGIDPADWDEQVADLHYADRPEYATGHGVSAEWELVDGCCRRLGTAWIPSAEVEKTQTAEIPGLELEMARLGALPDGAAAAAALRPLVAAYRAWIERQRLEAAGFTNRRKETAEELLRFAGRAAQRIERGIAVLADDPAALEAFKMANRAVGRAISKRLKIEHPKWRAFQLAFLLLNLPGLADPRDPAREIVDLLFFPTGGGKTEAYLGLAAFGMVLRRLRHREVSAGWGGAGVSVIMRYTLRLLTLDQLGRAAGLVCALELEREKDPGRYGDFPFEVGLWVGKAATPNVLGHKGDGTTDSARLKVIHFKQDPRRYASPIPLENCPWCGRLFTADSFSLYPTDDRPEGLKIVCLNPQCPFTRDRALPILAVDEMIYRRLPAFLIATVDKFAALPWIGPSGALLGGADRRGPQGFYGPAEPGEGAPLAQPLPPPDLVIQDELHLISGPLGTMAGLYETAIEALALRELEGEVIRPKIVASTATVRRAQDQIQALFGRPQTAVFPPPGISRRDSFFARTVSSQEANARLYVGIAAQGRNPKVVLNRTWLALMGAAERAYHEGGGEKNPDNPADPYMTVLGYFNSLRELGGCRRILEEQVNSTVRGYGARKRVGEATGLFRDRRGFGEVLELTSREPTNQVAATRRRLECRYFEKEHVDCAIATNMISVGLDIPRLGLMVVQGQPKTHSEYIQATSRVGRDDKRPGLVVTLLNIHKPRDRSHYERFRHYHETFYRAVEVGSVTPFSARALDRGLAGALVALARHLDRRMAPPEGAGKIAAARSELERRLLEFFKQRVDQQPFADDQERQEKQLSVRSRVVDLLDSWRKIWDDYQAVQVALQYQEKETKQGKPLLRDLLERDFETEHHRKFRVNRSLREVEPVVTLYLKEFDGRSVEGS